jgi:rhodanese-related sulfurtransferase
MSQVRLSPQEAFQHMKGQAKLVDVRTPAEFGQIHAEGALNIPMDRLDPGNLPEGEDPVILICRSGQRASQCAARLAGLDRQILIVEGGTEAWSQAGLPVVRGRSKVISLERQVRITVGSLAILFSLLALTVHSLFVLGPLFLGTGLVFAGITDWCGMGLLLARMPWNR